MKVRFAAGVVLAAGALIALPAAANDFPTQARVEFVLQCMNSKGGQSYDTLYGCVCTIDRIAGKMSYEAYGQAETLTFLYGTPGERGGVFRDAAPHSRERVRDLEDLRAESEAACFVGKRASAAQ